MKSRIAMIKIKKINLSGFRGIRNEKTLEFHGAQNQTNSLVLYGPNSTGKTSFVDGIEWFLSRANQIEWLRREQAKEAAYPHHEASESFVEIEFKKDGSDKTLRKTFDHSRRTMPILSSDADFDEVYDSFVIKPYLRYQEIVEFVLNSTGVEKYKKLAEWMGFEYELSFQKKLAEVFPNLENSINEIKVKIDINEREILRLSEGALVSVEDSTLTQYVNSLLKRNNKTKDIQVQNLEDLEEKLPKLRELQIKNDLSKKLIVLSEAEVQISSKSFSKELLPELEGIKKQLEEFKNAEGVAKSVDTISLYSQAQSLLIGEDGDYVHCPICHYKWKKDELLQHISEELASLEEINAKRESLSRKIKLLRTKIDFESKNASSVINKVEEIGRIVPLSITKIQEYKNTIDKVFETLNPDNVISSASVAILGANVLEKISEEKNEIEEKIGNAIKELKPSDEEERLSKDIERLGRMTELWKTAKEEKGKESFYKIEIERFKTIGSEINEAIKRDIQARFDEVSELIRTYFGKLRTDKDIRDIQITYNISGRAENRSAEIELLYYDVEVKPAYKVLSESLLSGLGLSIYFACVKKFNTNAKFIILDDVINSLDGNNRSNLIKILAEDFSDYQIIVFTHDRLWFEYIQQRCPGWIRKKIVDWSYDLGPQIGLAVSKKEELYEKLKDDTQTESAGRDFGEHVEGRLNQLAENLEAKLRYRYMKQDPPALRELFDSLNSRLKELKGKGAISEDNMIMKSIGKGSNDDAFIRNVCAHDRRNYEGFVTSHEVKQVVEQWFDDIEPILQCSECNNFIYFDKRKNKVSCDCGHLDLSKSE